MSRLTSTSNPPPLCGLSQYFAQQATSDEDDGDKTLVHVISHIYRLLRVDMATQSFTVDMKLELSWDMPEVLMIMAEAYPEAPREWHVDDSRSTTKDAFFIEKEQMEKLKALAAKDETLLRNLKRADEKGFFTPRIRLANVENFFWGEHYYVIKNGMAIFRWHFKATFQTQFRLHRFPFDKQDLTIEIKAGHPLVYETPSRKVSRSSTTARKGVREKTVLLVQDLNKNSRSLVQKKAFVQSAEYTLFDRVCFVKEETPSAESSAGHQYSLLKIKMRIHRHIGFWIINVYVPMFIISMTLFASYMLPISETADRLAASLTLMLAMVTFKYVISDRLPHISYLTYIDRYMLACFILAFVIVFMQSLAMGGIVNEPSLTWLTQADINASSTTTDDDVSDSGWLATATVTWAFSSPRIARINLNMVILLSSWLLFHVAHVLIVCRLYMRRNMKSPFWKAERTAVWIGPLDSAQDQDGHGNALERLKKPLKDSINDAHAKALDDETATDNSGDGSPPRQPVVFDVILYQTDSANAKQGLENGAEMQHLVAKHPEWVKRTNRAPFAIVLLTSTEAADRVGKMDTDVLRERLGSSLNLQNVKIAPLPEELLQYLGTRHKGWRPKLQTRSSSGRGRGSAIIAKLKRRRDAGAAAAAVAATTSTSVVVREASGSVSGQV